MNNKKKLDLDTVLDETGTDANAFQNADTKENEHKELKHIVTNGPTEKKAGRPITGKSKATNKIAFMVDDEMLEYLESLTTKQDRTPNSIAKKLFVRDYELHKNKG